MLIKPGGKWHFLHSYETAGQSTITAHYLFRLSFDQHIDGLHREVSAKLLIYLKLCLYFQNLNTE